VLAIQILLYYLLAVVFKILQTKHKANIDISLQYSSRGIENLQCWSSHCPRSLPVLQRHRMKALLVLCRHTYSV